MKRCAIQQNAMSGCEEVKRNSISVSDRMDSLVCPKPRRLGVASPSINDHFRSLRYHVRYPWFIRFAERVGKSNYIEFTVLLTTGSLFAFFCLMLTVIKRRFVNQRPGLSYWTSFSPRFSFLLIHLEKHFIY